MKKKRLDEILIERGIAKDKSEAFIMVTEGNIYVGGQRAISPAQMYLPDVLLRMKERPPYVGRGGLKLAAAFELFDISIEGKVCADIGAATGGFTDVMLHEGAKKVYAIDLGMGKLALKLREDPRVIVMEQTNILYLKSLPEPIEFASIDVSFTSLRLVLPALRKFLVAGGKVVALFKPQYEVQDNKLRHGVVEAENIREEALAEFADWARVDGWSIVGRAQSPISGAKGNIEYLVHLHSRSD